MFITLAPGVEPGHCGTLLWHDVHAHVRPDSGPTYRAKIQQYCTIVTWIQANQHQHSEKTLFLEPIYWHPRRNIIGQKTNNFSDVFVSLIVPSITITTNMVLKGLGGGWPEQTSQSKVGITKS